MIKRTAFIFGIVVLLLAAVLFEGAAKLSAVSAQEQAVSNPITPAAAPPAQVLYVGNDRTPGQVLQINLPLTASSTSNFAITSNNVTAVAPDANGNLAVGPTWRDHAVF